jgi:hypothetical protein
VRGRIAGLERNPANLLPVVMEAAIGMRPKVQIFGNDYDTPDGTGVRDYVHVSDLAVGHLKALDWIDRNDRSLTVNLGSEEGLSVLELVEAARRITGRPVPAEIVGRRPGDPAKLTASSRRARDLLGWKAEYSDVDTLVRTSWDPTLKTLPQRVRHDRYRISKIDPGADPGRLETLLTAIPALSPESGGEGELAKCEAWGLAALPGSTRLERTRSDSRAKNGVRPNLVATIPGASDTRRLWIMSHLDVFPGRALPLETDPWKAVVADGRIYGRAWRTTSRGWSPRSWPPSRCFFRRVPRTP